MSKQPDLSRFEGPHIEKIYPCGEKRIGVPYARDYYLSHPEVLSNGKTRDVNGKVAKTIADNVKKFDEKTGVLSNAFRVMRESFSK